MAPRGPSRGMSRDVEVLSSLLAAPQEAGRGIGSPQQGTLQCHLPCRLPPQLAMGKMMEQGPVLIVTFHAQLVMVIKNPKGEVVEGDPVSEWTR